jgi:hypothetical protein
MARSPLAVVSGWNALAWSSFLRLLSVVRSSRYLLALVLALLAVDLFWTLYFGVGKLLHYLERYSTLYYHKELLITTDGGLPELYLYLKTLVVVALLVRLFQATGQPAYAALGGVFLVVLLDDLMEIHEYVGRNLVPILDLQPISGLRARDVGEVITWAGLGVLVLPLLWFGLWRSDRRHRGNGLAFLIPFGLLLFSAIFIDQLYGDFSDAFFGAGILLDMAEDGGEMVAISLACALALGAWRECQSGHRA